MTGEPRRPKRSEESELPELYEGGSCDEGDVTNTTLVFKPDGATPPGFAGAPVELNVVKTRGASQADSADSWVAIEVWTQNHIYMTRHDGQCIRAHDRKSGLDDSHHKLLGAALTGGRYHGRDRIELSQPLPVPGMKAVFRCQDPRGRKDRFVTTSRVERVVVRLGVTTLDTVESAEAFHELTARFFMRSG